MYGLLIESLVEIIKSKYGNSVWEVVRKKAKINNQIFSTHQQYSETLILRIVKHLSDSTGNLPKRPWWLMFALKFKFEGFWTNTLTFVPKKTWDLIWVASTKQTQPNPKKFPVQTKPLTKVENFLDFFGLG
jgi:hypothetical protein